MSYRVNRVLTMLKTILPSLPRAVIIFLDVFDCYDSRMSGAEFVSWSTLMLSLSLRLALPVCQSVGCSFCSLPLLDGLRVSSPFHAISNFSRSSEIRHDTSRYSLRCNNATPLLLRRAALALYSHVERLLCCGLLRYDTSCCIRLFIHRHTEQISPRFLDHRRDFITSFQLNSTA